MLHQPVHLSVEKFIEKCTVLEVPRFQRDYAWSEEEIKDFIDDWTELVTLASINSSADGHFLGGLVTVEERRNEHVAHKIVDGQQRLTTIFITVWRLKHAFKQILEAAKGADEQDIIKRAEVAVKTHDDYLFSQTTNQQFVVTKHERLILSNKDRGYFEELINDDDPKPDNIASHDRLKSAAEQIQKSVIDEILASNDSLETKFDKLAQCSNMLVHSCYVLHISSDNQNEAYKLFSVLNDRGKSLSDGDHLRWSSMELIDSHGDTQILEDVAEHWDNILANDPSEIAKFLEAYYPSKTGNRAKKTSIANDYRREFFSFVPPLSLQDTKKVRDRVSDMRKYMEVYRQLVDGSWPYDEPTSSLWTQSRLQRLTKDLKHTLCVPLLLSATENVSEHDFAKLVIGLEKFVFRYVTVVGARPSTLYPIYYRHAAKMESASTTYEVKTLFQGLSDLMQQNAPDEIFEQALRGEILSYEPPKQLRTIRYFLTTMNDYCEWTNKGPRVLTKPQELTITDLGQVQIEHIYPQTAKQQDADTSLESLKHNLGNLTFWAPGENKKGGNKNYKDKVPEYLASQAKMTSSIGSRHKTWSKNKVKAREDELIEAALKVFKV